MNCLFYPCITCAAGYSRSDVAVELELRSSSRKLHKLDPKIDITLNKLRKSRSINIGSINFSSILESVNNNRTTNLSNFSGSNRFESKPNIPDNQSYEPMQMENNNRTLKELAIPDFHGLVGKDPHKHLKEFHVVCSTMRLQGILEDYIKMKTFPFSLDGAAKDWLYLQPVMFNTWGYMKCMFLEKFFPAFGIVTIRKEICEIKQHLGETLHEYWERFNKLCPTCPHHQINE
ncbi:hypothetical protein CR513_31284, partial [Mucuna pruriens]